MNRIVIVGAGYSGLLTAKKLERRLRKREDASITVIDRNPFHTMLTELHEVAAGRVEEDSVRISLRRVFAGRRIFFVQDAALEIDFDKRAVQGEKGRYEYDYLVIAAGSRPAYYGVPGAREHALTLWSYEDAVRVRERVESCFRRASVETDEGRKRELLTFYVVGAGFTGVEMAGELAEYVPVLCEKHDVERELVTVVNVDMLPRAVPNLPERLSRKIERRLVKMGVELRLGTFVREVGGDYIVLERGDEKSRCPAGTVIWVAGIEGAEIAQKAAGRLQGRGRGRIETDEYLRSVGDKRVFIAGDVLYFVPEGEKDPVPQMVENCEQCSSVIARNIADALKGGKGAAVKYRPKFHGVMVSVGGRYGVAYVGGPRRKVSLPSFFAMFVKHFINIVYFAQVLGWNKIAGYLKHEFFTIRNKRSFVGGHFSNRTPSFLAVPLRLWLGAAWLFEGIKKIVEGWLDKPKLAGFFNDAAAWFAGILGNAGVQATTAATAAGNAVTGATPSAPGAAGSVLLNVDFLGVFRLLFVCGRPLKEAAIADYALKLDVPLVNWFVGAVVLSSDAVQLVMQAAVVMLEILIGLSLIGGLFSTPSSAASIALLLMFTCTTGLYLSNAWMFFAAVAFLWGAGSVFGVDYYTTPRIKNAWRRLGWVRRLYLYHD